MKDLLKRILRVVALVGPGLFCLGFTIGTGSVTSMVKSGSVYGTDLLWVLAIIGLVGAVISLIMSIAQGAFNASSILSLALSGLMFWIANNIKTEAGK